MDKFNKVINYLVENNVLVCNELYNKKFYGQMYKSGYIMDDDLVDKLYTDIVRKNGIDFTDPDFAAVLYHLNCMGLLAK